MNKINKCKKKKGESDGFVVGETRGGNVSMHVF